MWESIFGENGKLYLVHKPSGIWYDSESHMWASEATGWNWSDDLSEMNTLIVDTLDKPQPKPVAPQPTTSIQGETVPETIVDKFGQRWYFVPPGAAWTDPATGQTIIMKEGTWKPIGAPISGDSSLDVRKQDEVERANRADETAAERRIGVEVSQASTTLDYQKKKDELDRKSKETDQAYRETERLAAEAHRVWERARAERNDELARQAQEAANEIARERMTLERERAELDKQRAKLEQTAVLEKLAANPRDYVQYFNMVRPDLGGTVLNPKGTVAGGSGADPGTVLRSAPAAASLIGAGQASYKVSKVPGAQELGQASPSTRGVAASFASAAGLPWEDYEDLIKKYNPSSQFFGGGGAIGYSGA